MPSVPTFSTTTGRNVTLTWGTDVDNANPGYVWARGGRGHAMPLARCRYRGESLSETCSCGESIHTGTDLRQRTELAAILPRKRDSRLIADNDNERRRHIRGSCTFEDCRACYPRPSIPSHYFSVSYSSLRYFGDVPWRSAAIPCDSPDHCLVCNQVWRLTAGELLMRKVMLRQRAEHHALETRRLHAVSEINRRSHRRAVDLLRSILTEAQWREYEDNGYVTVTGSAGGRYRVEHGHSGNVKVIECGVPEYAKKYGDPWATEQLTRWGYLGSRCAHPEMYGYPVTLPDGLGETTFSLPDEDAMVAQIMRITTDEPGFFAISNDY